MSDQNQALMGNPIAQFAALAPAPRFTFKIPAKARQFPTDPKEITLKLITLAEEKQAAEAAKNLGTSPLLELVKHALVGADGKELSFDAAGKDRFIEACSPKVRGLLVLGYKRLHETSEEEDKDFFLSQESAVG